MLIFKEEQLDVSDNIDGEPVDQVETDDDTPMDGAALLKSVMKQNYRSPSPATDIEDIDGLYLFSSGTCFDFGVNGDLKKPNFYL